MNDSQATRIYRANLKLSRLIDNDKAEDATDYKQVCDGDDACNKLVTLARVDEYDGMCAKCWKATHFTCKECHEEFHNDERCDKHKGLCEGCGYDKDSEQAGNLWSEIEAIAGEWDNCDDLGVARLKKLLAYAKKLKK